MNRSRTYRMARRAVWGTLAVVMTFGCSPLTTIAFLFHKDTKEPAQVALTKKDKKASEEIRVAVFVQRGSGQGEEFAGIEAQLTSELARKLPEMALENKQKLVILPTKDVNRFKKQNPNWRLMHPSEWGKSLNTDFVLDIHLDKMNMYQPGSQEQIYAGHAEITVDTYDVDAGKDEPKNYSIPFNYPSTPRDAQAISLNVFKKHFIDNLALEIARKHVDHRPADGIAEDR